MILKHQIKKSIAACLFLNFMLLTIAPHAVATEQPKNQQTYNLDQKKIGTNLEATITLVELQEILAKIKEDLDERTELLGDGSSEIIDLLESRRKIIIEYITKLHGLDEEAINMYLNKIKRDKKGHTLFWVITITVALLATATLVTASYDMGSGTLNRPSIDQLKRNLEAILECIKRLWAVPPAAVPPVAPVVVLAPTVDADAQEPAPAPRGRRRKPAAPPVVPVVVPAPAAERKQSWRDTFASWFTLEDTDGSDDEPLMI